MGRFVGQRVAAEHGERGEARTQGWEDEGEGGCADETEMTVRDASAARDKGCAQCVLEMISGRVLVAKYIDNPNAIDYLGRFRKARASVLSISSSLRTQGQRAIPAAAKRALGLVLILGEHFLG